MSQLSSDVAGATNKLAEVKAVREVLGRVLGAGAAQLLEMRDPAPENSIGFVTDDGSTETLLGRLREHGTLPPTAYGVRMIAPGAAEGGKSYLPKLARLAGELGFHIRVVVDNDKPESDGGLIAELAGVCEQVVHLPERTSVERAL